MKVCVIGTGPAGLTTIKQLRDEGHEVTCFERQKDLGGLWFRHENDSDEMKAYDQILLTTSIRLMAYSDFMPEGPRKFFTREQYWRYLLAYAEKYGLRESVEFDSAVEGVTRLDDGRWSVRVTSGGRTVDRTFDAVAICQGSFTKPNMNVAGLDQFTGEVLHSSRYRNAARFAGKRVLVVGLGESGADVLREVSEVAASCTLSIRTYVKLVPRLNRGNVATDATVYRANHWEKWIRAGSTEYPSPTIVGETRAERLLFKTFATLYGAGAVAADVATKVGRRLLGKKPAKDPSGRNALGGPLEPEMIDVDTELTKEIVDAIEEWNIRSHEAVGGTYVPKVVYCKNVSFIPCILKGKLDVKHGHIVGMEGKTVRFSDGTEREFDAIVLATGFQKNFSILTNVEIPEGNVRNLYKHTFHPDFDGRLAMIGFVRPFTGGIPVCAELQARYFALLCSGKLKLPADVRDRIAREKAWEEAQTALSPRHTATVPSQPLYTDSIAKEIGCLASTKDLILDPRLFIKHWFASFNQMSYRLVGPHAMRDEARRRLLEEWTVQREEILHHVYLSWLPSHIYPKHVRVPQRVKDRFKKGDAVPIHFLRPEGERAAPPPAAPPPAQAATG